MEAVETWQRCRNTEKNGGEGHKTMEDNVTRTETYIREDDNRGGGDEE